MLPGHGSRTGLSDLRSRPASGDFDRRLERPCLDLGLFDSAGRRVGSAGSLLDLDRPRGGLASSGGLATGVTPSRSNLERTRFTVEPRGTCGSLGGFGPLLLANGERSLLSRRPSGFLYFLCRVKAVKGCESETSVSSTERRVRFDFDLLRPRLRSLGVLREHEETSAEGDLRSDRRSSSAAVSDRQPPLCFFARPPPLPSLPLLANFPALAWSWSLAE